MKKEERLSFIKKDAYELAKTGKYQDWLSIETALRGDGFTEARRVLDNDIIRKELNDICVQATSKEETQNRELFDNWLRNFLANSKEHIKSNYPMVTIFVSEIQKHFTISSDKKEYKIRKEFGTKKIVGDAINEEADGRRYKLLNTYHSQKDFDEFSVQDLIEIVKRVC
jgi:hypothetical protein